MRHQTLIVLALLASVAGAAAQERPAEGGATTGTDASPTPQTPPVEQMPPLGEAAPPQQQVAPPRAQGTDDAEATPAEAETATAEFLTVKRRQQQRREAALHREGAGAEVAELRQALRASGARRPRPFANLSARTTSALEDSLMVDSAQLLANLQLRPGRARQLRSGGFDPFDAAVDFTRGTLDYDDLGILSDTVVVARPIRVEDGGAADGFGSTVQFEVVQTLAGRAPAANRLSMRQAGTSAMPLDSTITAADGQRYLLFLSRGWYKNSALGLGGTPVLNRANRGRFHATLVAPMVEREGRFVSTALSTLPPIAIGALESRLAPLVRFRTQNNLDLPTEDQ